MFSEVERFDLMLLEGQHNFKKRAFNSYAINTPIIVEKQCVPQQIE